MRALSVIVMAGLAACSGAPTESQIASLVVVSGNGQTGSAGTLLPQPLVVKVLDSGNQPIAGALVNFRVAKGNGSVFAGGELTDANGLASERWTLGTMTGAQSLEARAVDSAGNEITYGTFAATAVPGARKTFVAISPNPTDGIAGAALATPPTVQVADPYGNVKNVAGIPVTFTLTGGGGSIGATSSVTVNTVNGKASVPWTLGNGTGDQAANTLTVSSPGMTSLTLTANGHQHASAIAYGPNGSHASYAGFTVPALQGPSVLVTDQFGHAVGGYNVQFHALGGGSVGALGTTTVNVTTDNTGLASTPWFPGPTQTNSVVASAGGTSPAQLVYSMQGISSLAVDPVTADAGHVAAGASSLANTVTITNTTAASVGYGGLNFVSCYSGAHQADFVFTADSCTGATLAPQGTCQLQFQYRPQEATNGPAWCVYQVLLATGEGGQEFTLQGTGDAAPPSGVLVASDVSATPVPGLSYGFPDTPATAISPHVAQFTITNFTSTTYTLADLHEAGGQVSEFPVDAGTCTAATLAPGDSCQFTAHATPDGLGFRTTQVFANFAGPAGSFLTTQIAIQLYVSATAPLVADASVVGFGPALVGTSTGTHTITFANAGAAALSAGSVTLYGPHSADATIVSESCSGATLLPGGSCSAVIQMRPSALDERSAELTVQFHSSVGAGFDTSATIDLRATGVDALNADPHRVGIGTSVGFQTGDNPVSFTNYSPDALTYLGMSLTGAPDVGLAANGCAGVTLAPGATCILQAHCTPAIIGEADSTLTLAFTGASGEVDEPVVFACTGL